MLVASLLSIVCALSTASALPASLLPVRPYVFLAPELPKFQLQPTVKVQPSAAVPPKPDATRQYVLVYPYQFVATRQDEASGSGFFESIQNFFINFGQSQQQQQNDEGSLDAVEIDKPAAAAATALIPPTPAPAAAPEAEKPAAPAIKIDGKQKFVYSYITPASTVPLAGDRRLFFLAEQPQLYGTFSGPSVNPVFSLQPLPVLASRANVAQPSDEPQPGKIVSENMQKFSQIPPVMATVEQKSSEPLMKSVLIEEPLLKSVPIEEPLLKSVPIEEPLLKLSVLPEPVLNTVAIEEPLLKTVEEPLLRAVQEPLLKAVEEPLLKTVAIEEPLLKPIEEPLLKTVAAEEPLLQTLAAEEPLLKSIAGVQEQSDVVQPDLAENRVAPVIADNRAIAVPEEIVKVPEVKVAAEEPVASVVLARSNAVPLIVDAAEIPIEKSADPVPIVPSNEAIVESANQVAELVVPELKDIGQTVKLADEAAQPAPAPVVDQSLPSIEPVAVAETN